MKSATHNPDVSNSHTRNGFSLLEVLVASALMVVITAGVLQVLYEGQETFGSQTRLNRANEQARIAMDVMVRYLRHAGNDPLDFMKTSGTPAVQIVNSSEMVINSDITGAVDSVTGDPKEATGDPDGALDSIHERCRFRHDSATQQLFMDIGYGETILATGIVSLNLDYLDSSGTQTTNSNDVAQVNIRMIGRADRSGQRLQDDRLTLHSEVFLRSKAFNPFEANAP